MNYLLKLWVLVSQTLNVVLFNGDPDMTVSSRCYIQRHKKYWGVAYDVINRLFFFQDNHCKSSFDADYLYANKIIQYCSKQV